MPDSELERIRRQLDKINQRIDRSLSSTSESSYHRQIENNPQSISSAEHKKPKSQAEKLFNSKNLRKLGATALLITILAGGYRAFQAEPVNSKSKPANPSSTDKIYTNLDDSQLAAEEANLHMTKFINLSKDSGEFKSFMDYRAITDPTSRQYNLLQSPNIVTNNQGLRCYQLDGYSYPLIAVGSGITTEVGQRLNVFIQSDQNQEYILQAIVGDLKDNDHTDPTNTYHIVDNSVIEFLVDTKQLKQAEPLAATMGDLSYINTGQFNGAISKIEILNQIVDY